MAGLGRRTHYRKHLTDSVLHDLPEPNPPHSRLAKVLATRGSNQFDVQLASSDGQKELAILPTKFRKLVWLKRNDYVIVDTADDAHEGGAKEEGQASSGGIRCIISHILYQDQIKHLVGKGLWPKDDPDFVLDNQKLNESANSQPEAEEGGIVYNDPYLQNTGDAGEEYDSGGGDEGEDAPDDPLLFVNTNRLARLAVQDSSSSEEEDDG